MESLSKLLGFLLLLWITATAKALPDPTSKNEVTSSKNIVGVASQIISNALMRGQADSTSNYVFSPIGYATILSILSQGSFGKTRQEISQVLEQPDNFEEVASAYRLALSAYTGNDSEIAPQFKTWFYIYRNNTAEEKFKKLLTDDYLVEIKDIDRFPYDFDSPRIAEEDDATNSKDIAQFDDLKNTEPKDDMGSIDGFDTLKTNDDETSAKVEAAIAEYDMLNQDEKNKVSKFDKHVEDEQYVEVPEIKKEELQKKKDTSEKEHLKKKLQASEGPEKISLPFKKYLDDSEEIMDATENRNFVRRFGRAQPLSREGDVTSALSGNSIVGRKGGDSSSELESKMLLFNGLYFRGHWAEPFMELRSDDTKYFHALSGDQDIKFMLTYGAFKYADIPSKQLKAVELPYKNERYAMLIVMPETVKDLKHFSRESDYNSVNEIVAQLESSDLTLYVPKFRMECTSRAEKALGKLGLTTLFTSKADLSGITKDADNYQIEELVQHVAVRVDENSSSSSALSAGNVEGRVNAKAMEFSVDKPFLFYVRDVAQDIILAAGKIVEVPVETEIPISFN
ncbi:CLUMA_CG003436, isoform A [Clunio marinus]|uniref:CLUMA_CG003436, isoform A n=1 Tax=Clunio marinus TaxID=568069 RepID=A0A1J1HNS7_9DIPT|nr:CLUMA_CG003436, isoform A [Clunio marinus]